MMNPPPVQTPSSTPRRRRVRAPGLSANVFEDVYLGVATGTAAALVLLICLGPFAFGLLPRSFRLPTSLVITVIAFTVGWLTAYGAACRRRDWARARQGKCLGCGYDLRASTDRCPECGRGVPRGRGSQKG
jgi:hypothetical protein